VTRAHDLCTELVRALGVLGVDGAAFQEAADLLVAAGVDGVVNFAPVTLTLPPHVDLVSVDLAIELEQLSFAVINRLAKPLGDAAGS
jgi:redox-sensing transcriptional repressor